MENLVQILFVNFSSTKARKMFVCFGTTSQNEDTSDFCHNRADFKKKCDFSLVIVLYLNKAHNYISICVCMYSIICKTKRRKNLIAKNK